MIPTAHQLKRLIGNPAAYAVQQDDGQWRPVRIPNQSVWEHAINKHLAGEITIGTYVLSGDQARTLVFDIDQEFLPNAVDIKATLEELGVPSHCIAIEFSGRKGYHVWVVVQDYVFATHLRRLGRAVLGITGIDCEVFPKQDAAKDLGNLVKLPGGIHRVSGKRAEFLVRPPLPMTMLKLEQVLGKLPPEPDKKPRPWDGEEGIPCVSRITQGVKEGGRDTCLLHLGVMGKKAGYPEDINRMVVEIAADRCDPPYTERPMDELMESVARQGAPMCSHLPADVHCGEACILNRTPGLHVRERQLAFAAEGQKVVVEVEEVDGKNKRLAHPDLLAGGKGYCEIDMREYTILITVEDYIDLSDEDAITVTEFVSDVHGRDVEILEVEEA